MSEEMTFTICGRELVLPATPDPIVFSWEKEERGPQTSMRPKRRRYRLKKKKKAN